MEKRLFFCILKTRSYDNFVSFFCHSLNILNLLGVTIVSPVRFYSVKDSMIKTEKYVRYRLQYLWGY